MKLPRIIITTGEPAGIGPDITLKAAASTSASGRAGHVVAIGDRDVLQDRAKLLGLDIELVDYATSSPPHSETSHDHQIGKLPVIHQPCKHKVVAGELNFKNSEYVMSCIDAAVDACLAEEFDAMTTAPVNKAIINQAGIRFSGHTEYIAERCQAEPVMMLANRSMRACLLTTHVPLAEVAKHVTADRITQVVTIILNDLRRLFRIQQPTLGVCGLNPHAGENGYIGKEEIEIITPALDSLRAQGADIVGPISADTAFTKSRLASLDAVLAIYHDQALPVVKHADFGETVNLTLGLPIIRTSVDHGTAVELVGTTEADESSLKAAIKLAAELSANKKPVD